MAFISQDEINNIRNATSIVDVISSYIPLTQKGKNYFGVCPFHEDHAPSMSVSSEKQIYKCFSCGATGNVFTFVENYLNISFAEAVSLLADKAGINISKTLLPKKEVKYKEEYDLMNFVMKFYQNNLNTSEGDKAVTYLNKRGLIEKVQKDFDIGLSFDKNMLYKLLHKKGYKDKILEDLGLIKNNDGHFYDVFQNRIMFPIHNLDGDVVGFTARCYLEDVTPKYLNTKETYIFKKGNILFNYHRAKDQIRLKKSAIVVEGNMDAIRMYSNGFKNTIALMGTSLTKEQITILKKLKSKIILMLDNDNAGEVATFNVGNALEENGIEVLVVRLSRVKDPDEYIISFGSNSMEDAINNAIPFIDFKLNYLKKNKNLDSSKDLAEYIKAILNELRNSNDDILTEVTLQKLVNDYNISYDVLKKQLSNIKSDKHENIVNNVSEKKKENKSSYEKIVSEILYCMMNGYEYIKLYQTQLGIFPTKSDRAVANEIIYYYEMHKTINLADFISYAASIPLKKEIMDIISSVEIKEINESVMMELLNKIKKKIKTREIDKLKEEIRNEYDINKKVILTEKMLEIKKGSVENEND
jgi:DNA primase